MDGAILGAEVPIVEKKLSFMADYLSGTSGMSVAVIGMVYTTESEVQFSAGVQVPSPGSDAEIGAVFELTVPSF